jgi:hypothetical protein
VKNWIPVFTGMTPPRQAWGLSMGIKKYHKAGKVVIMAVWIPILFFRSF